MPELPEVETVRRGVQEALVGRRIDDVVLGRLRTVRRVPDPVGGFVVPLRGRTVTGTRRHGKYLIVDLSPGDGEGDDVLLVHLRMSGQLLHGPADAPLLAHTHVRLRLDDGTELRFVDPRTFGEMFLTSGDLPEIAAMGVDALDPAFSAKHLRDAARGRTVTLKAFLLDQGVVAGVGSIYADEVCFRAGLRPARSVARVSGPQWARVHVEIINVLGEAVEAKGSTLADRRYVGVDGSEGSFAERHRVHAREGRPCQVCGATIRRSLVAQRSAYWCPVCQR